MTPAGARELTRPDTGLVEKGAGVGSSIIDADYVRTGATIVETADDVWAAADLAAR